MPSPPSATYERLRDTIAERMRMSPIDQPLMPPGSPGELPPEAPTDPDVTLSRHPAPVIQPPPHPHRASAQIDPDAVGQFAPEAHDYGDSVALVAVTIQGTCRRANENLIAYHQATTGTTT